MTDWLTPEDVDIPHLLTEHRAATDEIKRLRDQERANRDLVALGRILARFIEEGPLDPWVSHSGTYLSVDGNVDITPEERTLLERLMGPNR